jgi:hypothetical protein
MDMTALYEIVGFDGLPVKGGIGIKPALVQDLAVNRYAVISGGRPRRWIEEPALIEAIERGLVTRFPTPLGTWSADSGVAYLDIQHIETPWGGEAPAADLSCLDASDIRRLGLERAPHQSEIAAPRLGSTVPRRS